MFIVFEAGDKVKLNKEAIEEALADEDPGNPYFGSQTELIRGILAKDEEGEIINCSIEEGADYFYDICFGGVILEWISRHDLKASQPFKSED